MYNPAKNEYMAKPYQIKQLKCMICYAKVERSFRPKLVAKCGHLACEECWKNALENKLECPYCKAKVRF